MAVLTLDAAKQHLNITTFAHDAELPGIIAAAEAAIAQRVGPLEPTAVTVQMSGASTMVLPIHPVISLTSVTNVAGTALPVGGFTLRNSAGLLTSVSGATFGSSLYTIVYQAGRTTVPADLLLAVKELVRHLWESQRGPTRRPGSTADAGTSAAGYLLPYRVQELIAPHMQFGFA